MHPNKSANVSIQTKVNPKPLPKAKLPSTETLSTIAVGSEHSTFNDIPKVHLHQPANLSTIAAGSSQNGGGASSTQTNGGDPHQSPLRVLSPTQIIQGGKWQICTDFMDLNKCCPKGDFPLTRIDKIIDSTKGCETMALLDSFSGYHQIWLHK
jgi:hypothetical protein